MLAGFLNKKLFLSFQNVDAMNWAVQVLFAVKKQVLVPVKLAFMAKDVKVSYII